jgi:hypothetical protein
MANAYEDTILSLGNVAQRSPEQQDLLGYAINKWKELSVGTANPEVQRILDSVSAIGSQAVTPTVTPTVTPATNAVTTPVVPTPVTTATPVETPVTPTPVTAPATTLPTVETPSQLAAENKPFESQYDQTIQQQYEQLQNYPEYTENAAYRQIINDLLKSLDPNFQYSAENDPALIEAQKQVSQAVQEEMSKIGALYSDTTASLVVQEMGKLVPQYRQQALSEFQTTFTNKLNMMSTVEGLLNDDYQKYTDAYDRKLNFLNITSQLRGQEFTEFSTAWTQAYQKREEDRAVAAQELQKQQAAFDQAMQRINTFGYVDNQSAQITGIAAGTRTYEAEQAIVKRQQELEDQQKAIDEQRKRDQEERAWQLEYLKAQEESEKRLAAYNASLAAAAAAKASSSSRSSGGGGSSGGSGSSGGGSVSYSSMTSALSQAASEGNLESFVSSLVFNSKTFIGQIGATNYNKLLKSAQSKFATLIKNNWKNTSAEDILNALDNGRNNNPDYYRYLMGDSAFQTMYDKAKKAWINQNRVSNPYYGR